MSAIKRRKKIVDVAVLPTPSLALQGVVYRVTTPGDQFNRYYNVNAEGDDFVLAWDGNENDVSSVFGRTGDIVGALADYALSLITDDSEYGLANAAIALNAARTAIAANLGAIVANDIDIALNAADIANDLAAIVVNAAGIAANLLAIQANDVDIATLAGGIDDNVIAIAANLAYIQQLQTDGIQILWVSKSGDNNYGGTYPSAAMLTFTAALVEAGAPADEAHAVVIVCMDAGTYTESLSIPAYVRIHAPNATFVGNQVMADHSRFTAKKISAASGTVVSKVAGSNNAGLFVSNITATGAAFGIVCTSGEIRGVVRTLNVANGYGFGGTSTGILTFKVDNILITGTGYAVGLSAAGELSLSIGTIEDTSGTQGTAFSILAGEADIRINHCSADKFCNLTANGTLRIDGAHVVATVASTIAGKLKAVISDFDSSITPSGTSVVELICNKFDGTITTDGAQKVTLDAQEVDSATSIVVHADATVFVNNVELLPETHDASELNRVAVRPEIYRRAVRRQALAIANRL